MAVTLTTEQAAKLTELTELTVLIKQKLEVETQGNWEAAAARLAIAVSETPSPE